MSTTEDIIRGIERAKAALEEHGAVPDRVEVTQAQFDALKAHCVRPAAPGTPDSILGLRVVVVDG